MNILGVLSLFASIVAFLIVGNPTYIYIAIILSVFGLIIGIMGIKKTKLLSIVAVALSVLVLIMAIMKLSKAIDSYENKKKQSDQISGQSNDENLQKMEQNGLISIENNYMIYSSDYIDMKTSIIKYNFISFFLTPKKEGLSIERSKVIINGDEVILDGYEKTTFSGTTSTSITLNLDNLSYDKYDSIIVEYTIYLDNEEVDKTGEIVILE